MKMFFPTILMHKNKAKNDIIKLKKGENIILSAIIW